jgi:aspartate/methionine/tyrosine aminotransferase
MFTFARLDRLPPYVFAPVNEIKMEARRAGQDIIDLGMGNPEDNVIWYKWSVDEILILDFGI